ncbi:protein cueball [Copidosoma floridanum]|uniref:protein cueball n=1 Tax=Copidosoma floridanum TaxID=29053 RepID=UPI0006C9DA74|nr:protein cueball [Copidosoma floridanum]
MNRTKGTVYAAAMLLVLVVLGLFGTVSARQWDLAVTIGKEIDFIARDGNLTGSMVITNTSSFVAMAYDDDTYTLFLSDAGNMEHSIVSVDLTAAKNITAKPLLKRDKDSQIQSMAFDGASRTLFWATEKSIAKMKLPLNGPPGQPIVVRAFVTESLRAIALDVCNRQLYWVNGNRSRQSIGRSQLDGSNAIIVANESLYETSSLAVDHWSGRLYWLDDEEGIHYKVEQSELDGSGRAILVHGNHHQPIHLGVDKERVYWTDYVSNAVWQIGKESRQGDAPRRFWSYLKTGEQADLTTLLARDNLGSGVDCRAMKAELARRKLQQQKSTESKSQRSRDELDRSEPSFSNLTTSSEQLRPKNECSGQGEFDKVIGTCRCKSGFSGSRCEISPCHNYCLAGECQVNSRGLPICSCGGSRSGSRCERDACDGYCLNNGQCLVENGKPSCECKYSSGARCEVTLEMAEICALFCMNRQFQMTGIDTASCRCSELNQTIQEVLGYDSFNCQIIVPLLSGFVGMLTIAVILLSFYVSRLKRRPRIKKRFVVNKTGITPLTSRPSPGTDSQQCEITIENCCNMNICETPCFEPKLRASSNGRNVTGGSNGTKKEEKSNLLDHMEVGPGHGC